MPTARLLLALAPGVPRAEGPGVQFDDQGEGIESQLKLEVTVWLGTARGRPHLLVEVVALFLGALALVAGRTAQGGGGDLHARQAFDQGCGLRGGHLADGQCGDVLDGGRLRARLGQAGQGIGGEAPFATAAAAAAGALHTDRAKAGLHGGPTGRA